MRMGNAKNYGWASGGSSILSGQLLRHLLGWGGAALEVSLVLSLHKIFLPLNSSLLSLYSCCLSNLSFSSLPSTIFSRPSICTFLLTTFFSSSLLFSFLFYQISSVILHFFPLCLQFSLVFFTSVYGFSCLSTVSPKDIFLLC
jgi:hypothetical protein